MSPCVRYWHVIVKFQQMSVQLTYVVVHEIRSSVLEVVQTGMARPLGVSCNLLQTYLKMEELNITQYDDAIYVCC